MSINFCYLLIFIIFVSDLNEFIQVSQAISKFRKLIDIIILEILCYKTCSSWSISPCRSVAYIYMLLLSAKK